MPAKTQDLRVMLQISKNLYEASIVMAKRAKQINEEMYQKKRDRQILEELEGGFDDDFMHADLDEKETAQAVEDDDNPVVHALEDFLNKKLHYSSESL